MKNAATPPDTLPALTKINTLLGNIQTHAVAIGITVATLMVTIYAMGVMFSGLKSASANRDKWEHLQTVLICAGFVAGGPILILVVQGFVTGLTGK